MVNSVDSESVPSFEEIVRWVRWSLAEVGLKEEQIPILQARKIIGHASYFVDFTQGSAAIPDDNEVFSKLYDYILQLKDEKCVTGFNQIHVLIENIKNLLQLLEFFDTATYLIFEVYPESSELTGASLKKIDQLISSDIPNERIKGITKWNDLLKFTFGKINTVQKKYVGVQGLEISLNEIQDFFKIHGKMPSSGKKGISGIYRAVWRGEWKEYDILKWKDIIKRAEKELVDN